MLLEILLGLCVLGALVIIVYAALKPSDNTIIDLSEKTPLKLESINEKEAVFSLEVPMRNIGEQDAAITDVFARPYLPQEQFPEAVCYGHVETTDRRRNDNYFEALILHAGKERMLIVTLRYVAACNKPMQEILRNMVDMDVALYINGVGRKALYVKKEFFTVFATDVKTLVGGAE